MSTVFPPSLFGVYVRDAYWKHLLRIPDSSGFTASVQLLESNGGTVTQLIAAIQDSPEGGNTVNQVRAVFWPPASAAEKAAHEAAAAAVPTTEAERDAQTAAFIRSRIPSSRD